MAQSRAQYESMVAAHAARQQRAGSAGAPRDRAREQISSRPGRARRHHRADADQARRPRAASATPATPQACAIPTPISPGASNISPAPIAPPTAITAAPCVIMRAAITTPQSASGSSGRCSSCRCSRAVRRRKSSPRPDAKAQPRIARSRARARVALLRRTGIAMQPPGPGSQRTLRMRCVRGTTAVQFPRCRVDTPAQLPTLEPVPRGAPMRS